MAKYDIDLKITNFVMPTSPDGANIVKWTFTITAEENHKYFNNDMTAAQTASPFNRHERVIQRTYSTFEDAMLALDPIIRAKVKATVNGCIPVPTFENPEQRRERQIREQSDELVKLRKELEELRKQQEQPRNSLAQACFYD
jgi:hypothetical protein